ncbi:MAG TPA: VWA domain-containing protein [Burkholderiales bacterium]|nr:VWA domain-containing protein [Burkholderiales bacterium]
MPPISFAVTWPLWLLAGLPLVWVLAWNHRSAISRRRVAGASLLRSAALSLLCIALMSPTLNQRVDEVSVVYAVDISHSISPAFLRAALDWTGEANRRYQPAQVRYVVFADKAKLVNSAQDVASMEITAEGEPVDRGTAPTTAGAIDQGATNLESALMTSVFGFAPDHAKRLVLLSDGNQTEGDLWRALPRLQAENIRVFSIPAAVSVHSDAWIEAVTAPDDIRQQEPVLIKVRVFSRTATRARIQMMSSGKLLGTQFAELSPGTSQFSFPARLGKPGANDITVQVFAQADQFAHNDALSETIWVGPRPKVLYVEASPESASHLADALTRQGIEVKVANTEQLAGEPALLDGMDAVILSDIRARSIDTATTRRLETFVRDLGGGLIFAAGENTYGKDGFSRSALERLLPVKFEAQRKRQDLDLVLLIDRSHSMRGRKLELAKAAALATLDLLDKEHRLALVAFDSTPHDVVPLAAVGSKRRAEDLIRSMTSRGQTNIFNGLWHAHRLLQASPAKTKHIILLSDGRTAPPQGEAVRSSSEQAMEIIRRAREDPLRRTDAAIAPNAPDDVPTGGYPELLDKLVAAKITLTTVALGDNPNVELMAYLASAAGGKNYVAERDSEIPGLFVAETRRLVGQSIVEEPFHPIVKGSSPSIAGVDFAAGPQLKGFVLSKPKKFSDVVLEAKKGQPLLAETRYGLGKTVAFLSDVKNRWSADWIDWSGYGQLWGQVVRDSIRRDHGAALQWRVTREGREAVIALRMFDPEGAYRNGLSPKVRVGSPDGQSVVIPLRQVAPGEYRTRISLGNSGAAPFRFELVEGPGLSKRDVARAGIRKMFYAYPDEYRVLPANLELLRVIAEATGGSFAPKTADIFTKPRDGGTLAKPVWQYFALAALFLFLLDILVRRASWRKPISRLA